MFENLLNFFKKKNKKEETKSNKDTAKERLHLVLMQDRANVSADFLEMMKQEIIEVIKKYVNVDEDEINVTLTNQINSDGTTGAPALYANIPIKEIKNEARSVKIKKEDTINKKNEENKEKQEKQVEKVNKENKEMKEKNKSEDNKEESNEQEEIEEKSKCNDNIKKKEIKNIKDGTTETKKENNKTVTNK